MEGANTVATGRATLWSCLWPGLPLAWSGSLPGLLLALGFGLLVHLALATTFVWSELLGSTGRFVVWSILGCTWLPGVLFTIRRSRRQPAEPEPQQEDLFQQALAEYLQRNWFKAESLLDALVRQDRRDVDAQLMRVTLWRHTGRLDDARRGLDELERWDAAAKWELEIDAERRFLAESAEEDEVTQPGDEPLGQVA